MPMSLLQGCVPFTCRCCHSSEPARPQSAVAPLRRGGGCCKATSWSNMTPKCHLPLLGVGNPLSPCCIAPGSGFHNGTPPTPFWSRGQPFLAAPGCSGMRLLLQKPTAWRNLIGYKAPPATSQAGQPFIAAPGLSKKKLPGLKVSVKAISRSSFALLFGGAEGGAVA